MLFCCGLFFQLGIAQQSSKLTKGETCTRTITFTTQTTISQASDLKSTLVSNRKQNFKKGQFSLCLDARGIATYQGKGLYPKDLLEIEEFVIALRQSAGDLRPDFRPLIRDAEERGAKIQELRDGTVSIKHRLRDGGQWVTLIDLNRQMLLGCSKYNREEYLETKLVCHYFRDGRQPPMLSYTVYSEYAHEADKNKVRKTETMTRFSPPVMSKKD